MNAPRTGNPGATRVCPHCKATVLESAAICPGCRHHLRFSGNGTTLQAGEGYCALNVDGTIVHTQSSEACEYCVVLDVRNDRGEQLTRQVVGVGVLRSGELRRLNVSVEMMPVRAHAASTQPETKPQSQSGGPRVAAVSPVAAVPAATHSLSNAPSVQKQTAPARPPAQPLAGPTPASILRLGVIRKPR
jgi:hypothetical protein